MISSTVYRAERAGRSNLKKEQHAKDESWFCSKLHHPKGPLHLDFQYLQFSIMMLSSKIPGRIEKLSFRVNISFKHLVGFKNKPSTNSLSCLCATHWQRAAEAIATDAGALLPV